MTTAAKRGHFADLRDHPRQSARQRHIEQRHLYSSLFTLPVVENLAQDEKSGIVGLDLFKTISMHCRFIGREADGISHVLNEELFKHSEQYGGIVVAFGRSSLIAGSAPSFEHDLRWIFHKVETTVYVFKPDVGCVLRGIVNSRSSPNFIGCLIHTVFNAAVWFDEDEKGIHGEIADGDEIDFQVTNVFYTSDTVTINGTLVGSRRRVDTSSIKDGTQEEETSHSSKDVSVDYDDGNDERDVGSVGAAVETRYSAVSAQFSSQAEDALASFGNGSTASASTTSMAGYEKRRKKRKKKENSEEGSSCAAAAERPFVEIPARELEPSVRGEETEADKKLRKKKEKKKDKSDAPSHSLTSIVVDASLDASLILDQSTTEVKVKRKKKKKDKNEKEIRDHGDAIPELVLEKKLKRGSEGSSNGVSGEERPGSNETYDDDDDFEIPAKKKRKLNQIKSTA